MPTYSQLLVWLAEVGVGASVGVGIGVNVGMATLQYTPLFSGSAARYSTDDRRG